MLHGETVGERLLAARRIRGLSRSAVGRLTGVSPRALEKLEADRQEVSLSRAVALSRLYGLSLDQLAGEAPLSGLLAPRTGSLPAEAAHGLLGEITRLLTGAPAVTAGDAAASDEADRDQAAFPELDQALQRLEAIDAMVATGEQPRRQPALVRALLHDGAALPRDELEALARERGLVLPDGLTGAPAVQLLIADAFYDGFSSLDVDRLDELADRLAAAGGIRRGNRGSAVAERRSGLIVVGQQRRAEAYRAELLRQLPPLIVDLALQRRLPLQALR